jgi:roundabout axon guidance receptor 2
VEDLPPPIISVGPSNQTRPMGASAVMPCIADGNPPPVITWYKNGNSFLLNHRVFTDDAGTLRINGKAYKRKHILQCCLCKS